MKIHDALLITAILGTIVLAFVVGTKFHQFESKCRFGLSISIHDEQYVCKKVSDLQGRKKR